MARFKNQRGTVHSREFNLNMAEATMYVSKKREKISMFVRGKKRKGLAIVV